MKERSLNTPSHITLHDGNTIPQLGLGVWQTPSDVAVSAVKTAIESGYRHIDTAAIYGNEEGVGEGIRAAGVPKDQIFITTKVWNADQGFDATLKAATASLKRLGLDHVDLYQIHRFDPAVPIEETLEALTDVVKAGKALHIGASSMYAWQFAGMLAASERHGYSRFATMQNHYNLIYREEEREMIPLCRSEGIGLIPWSPLARGFLAGNRNRDDRGETVRAKTDGFAHTMYYRDDDFAVVDRLSEVAAKRGVNNAQVALAWLLSKPGVTAPILGASKPQHLDDAVAALAIKLDPEEVASLEEPYRPHPVLGH